MARPSRSFALATAILAAGIVIAACGGSKVADVVPTNTTQLTPVLTNPTLDNEGGYAIVVTSAEVARNCRKTPVWVLGGAEGAYTC